MFTGPKESCDLAAQIEAAGAQYLEAPVLGSQPEASKGTLLIMVGSETNPQESKAWPVLTKLGKEPMHMGAVGTAAATKLALNQLIASLTVRKQPSTCIHTLKSYMLSLSKHLRLAHAMSSMLAASAIAL